MAPKAMKRPAAAPATTGPAPKKGRKPAVDPELKAKCGAVEDAIMSYEALPEQVRQMLSDSLENTLYIMKEERHQFQNNMVEMLAGVLDNIESSYKTEIQGMEEKLAGAEEEKAALTQGEAEAQAEVDKLKAVTSEASAASELAAKAVKDAKAALAQAKADQKAGDASFKTQEEEKSKLESTLNSVITPLKEASAKAVFAKEEKKQLKDFSKVCHELGLEATLINTAMAMFPKDPESRGTFEKMVEKELGEVFSKKIAQLASELEVHAPGKAERAELVATKESDLAAAETTSKEKEEAKDSAMGTENEAIKLLVEKAKALKGFEPEQKKASSALNKAKAALESFKAGALQGFLDLKELAPPPPEPEPVAMEEDEAPAEGESYYKIIDGVKYDRALLEAVEKFAADGQVGYPEAKQLWHEAEDGKGVTDVEKATLEYSMKTYKFTEKATTFVKTYLEAGTHKSYYKVIDGVKYDRQLLEDAMVDVADGQISWKEAKQLFAEAQDGKGLTGTEKDTFEYMLKTMKFTDKARAYLTSQLKAPTPKSYYKIIDGVKYDQALLLECEDAGKDGVISEAEAKRLFEEAKDHGVVTDIEIGTLKYALKTFKFSDPAKEFLTSTLGA